MVPASSHWVSRAPWYSGSCRSSHAFAYGAFTLSGGSFQNPSAGSQGRLCSPKPRRARAPVWALSRSLAATWKITVVFSSSGYLDVSVRRVPSVHLWIQCTVTGVFPAGFPHSDICGSRDICSSPQLFAAYCVFHRLPVPGHPPRAFFCLTRSCIALHSRPVFLFLLAFACSFACFSIWISDSVFGFQGTNRMLPHPIECSAFNRNI